jgi:hypothetical protein
LGELLKVFASTTHISNASRMPQVNLTSLPIKKCSAAIRMLAYGVAGDLVDEYMRISESTCIELMYNFCRTVISVFDEEYLREPNMEDTQRLLSINEKRGFPGMLESIDCMHWEWKNRPFA